MTQNLDYMIHLNNLVFKKYRIYFLPLTLTLQVYLIAIPFTISYYYYF